jgi:hypothetical protein
MRTEFNLWFGVDIFIQSNDCGVSVLADHYVHRDRTLVYKWRHDKGVSLPAAFPDIIRFVTENPARRRARSYATDRRMHSFLVLPPRENRAYRRRILPDYLLNV